MKAKKLPQAANTFGGPNNNAYREVFQMTTVRRGIPALFLGALLCLLLLLCLTPSAWADGNVNGNTVEQLQNAVNNGASTFTLTGDMVIPADTQIDAYRIGVVVPSGKTLTVQGRLDLPSLNLTGGSVVLQAKSRFTVHDTLTYQSGSINVYADAGVGIAGAGIVPKLDTIFSFMEQNGNINLLFHANNINELNSLLGSTEGLSNRYHAVAYVDFDWEVAASSTTIHEGLSLVLRRGFTLPEGCTLQMPQVGNLIVDSGTTAEVYGTVNGSDLIINPNGLLKLYGKANFNSATLNGTIDTYDGTVFSVYGEMRGLDSGCPHGTLCVGGSAYVMIEAKNLNTGAIAGWTVFHGDNSTLLLNYTVSNDEHLAMALQNARGLPDHVVGELNLTYPAVIREDTDFNSPKRVEITVNKGGGNASLEIAADKTVQTNKVILRGAAMTVKGKLISTGEIQFYKDQGRDPSFTVTSGGRFMGPGWFRIGNNCGNGNPQSCVQGISVKEGANYGNSTIFYSQNEAFGAIKAACAGDVQVDSLYLEGLDDFEIPESLTIPASLELMFRMTRIVIPDNVTLTVEGRFDTSALYIRPGGSVVVNGGYMNVANGSSNGFIIDGTLAINNGEANTSSKQWTEHWDASEKSRISYSGDSAVLRIHYEATNNDAESLIAAAGNVQAAHMLPVVEIRYPFTLQRNLTVPEGIFIRSYAGITIPAGLTMTVNSQLRAMEDSVIDVSGTLENNSFIDFRHRSDGSFNPRLIIENGAVYRGVGSLGIMDLYEPDSYLSGLDLRDFRRETDNIGTRYFPLAIDIKLPDTLTEIKSEAFAGDSFDSVYIPASVTVIASDAFSGMSGLTIYGVSGSEAETFAQGKYEFIAVG